MDISEYTRIVFDKLQRFEPEHATKIIGYLLLQDHGEQEMVKLASYPDHLIREVALKARTELQRLAAKAAILPISLPINPQQDLNHLSIISPTTPTSPASFQVPSSYWDPQSAGNTNAEFMTIGYLDSISELQDQTPLFSFDNHIDTINSVAAGIANDYYGLDASAGNLGGKAGRRFSNLSEIPVKTCHYFNKGFCKHGSSCRYYHGQLVPEIFSQIYGNDALNEDHVISPGSLAQLESEIVELLKARRGSPISIASLPMAYYDKYKKVLQAEGYLTESQRHGKSGYSLTKLLARLKNSIRLIDRPHGQHAVVLAEDAPKFMGKVDFGQNISASRQIYLTFPADSTFTEEDVSNYFSTFGCVEDVRIPCQQRRMFGFVTFVDPETVKMILDKGNPHYVRGSRVLVKPYKEKPKLIDRKYSGDRIEHTHYVDIDTELTSIPRSCGNHRFMRRLLVEEQERALEFQRRRLAELHLTQKTLSSLPHFGFNINGLKVSDGDHANFQPAESFSYSPKDKAKYTDTNYTDEDSQGLNLPDSPFAFPVDSGISTVM
ncbi:zinc finger CCCH domain-containing protein 18-like isoform X2 [Gastrolobium bilobum]|uniref:zinc finger CCCH domain-containing protein 18-like isoform X2 n=1 Tax=Gastrolobium bilobum TaxID=150636 RepID=UPI002AAF3F45|nr:zinc finger CCCH domain-containing protein 18-like isoform X2 [Gastrolobium bilobum]